MPGPEVTTPGAPGFYGKLPARGDFVSRRLEAGFIAAWDEWLQRVMAESREALGMGWLESYLAAPVWRFALPPGMFGDAGWIGVLGPSVDRVGRYFPLTLAASLGGEGFDLSKTLANATPWLEALEAMALEALKPDLDVDAFDQRLLEKPLPGDARAALQPNDDTVPLGTSGVAFHVRVVGGGAPALQQALAEHRSAASLWLTQGGEHFEGCVAACDALISGALFCAMLDGRWAEHGWKVSTKPDPAMAAKSDCDPKNPGVDLIHGQGQRGEEAPPLTAPAGTNNETRMNTGLEGSPSP